MNPDEKKDFQDTLKIIDKKDRKLVRLGREFDRLGEELDNCESNVEGKLNKIIKGLNNASTNNKNNNN